MKRYFAAILLLLPTLLTGCYNKWDYTGCPVEDNLILRFRLVDANGNDLFAGKIGNIDVALFDEYGGFVLKKSIKQNELAPDHSTTLTVEPGTYFVVAWANISSNSTMSAMDSRATLTGSYVETTSPVTGCPLYYAPSEFEKTGTTGTRGDDEDYKVTLPSGEVVEKELNFVRAHRQINIYIKGLENLTIYDGGQAKVELNSMPYIYDFYQDTDPARKNFLQTTETVGTGSDKMLRTTFRTPICDFSDDMTIRVLNGSNNIQLIDPVLLKKWVEDNNPAYLNEFDILISVAKAGETVVVTVTLPNWDNIGVKPGDL